MSLGCCGIHLALELRSAVVARMVVGGRGTCRGCCPRIPRRGRAAARVASCTMRMLLAAHGDMGGGEEFAEGTCGIEQLLCWASRRVAAGEFTPSSCVYSPGRSLRPGGRGQRRVIAIAIFVEIAEFSGGAFRPPHALASANWPMGTRHHSLMGRFKGTVTRTTHSDLPWRPSRSRPISVIA